MNASAIPSRTAGRARAAPPGRAVAAWLFVCCALVFAMVVVGGVTRLTHSGLSITEWQPIVGTLPPLNEAQWQEAFAKYRETPEFRQVNRDITLAGFQRIYWWEYAHRLLGRAIGVVFLLPFVYFLLRGRIPSGFTLPLGAIFVLGALQGAMGWYMVMSGLVDDPRVSQFRLTAHLAIAFLIFAAMLWAALSLVYSEPVAPETDRVRSLHRYAIAFVVLVFVMVMTGGLVAGIRAGFAYNTYPLMNGQIVPPEIGMLEPWWRNLFWNMATVQFDHRVLALALALAAVLLWWRLGTPAAPPRARAGARVLLALVALQIALGIATLVNVVPLTLAAMHQAGAMLVFASALYVAHALR